MRDVVVAKMAEMAVSAAGIGAGESGVDFKEGLVDAQEEQCTLFLDEHDCKYHLVFEIIYFRYKIDMGGKERT